MKIRYKIFILLFSATLGLGTFILLQPSEDHDDALRLFRSFFSDPPVYRVQDLSNHLALLRDESSLWYGGIAFFALIMMGLTFKMGRGGPPARNLRPGKLPVAKTEPLSTRNLLQDGARQEQGRRKTKDAPAKDLEVSTRRVHALEAELSEKEKLLESRGRELETLQTQVSVLIERPEENLLREELRKKTESLRQKESSLEELENGLGEKVDFLESQLKEKEKLLKSRSEEAEALRSELNTASRRLTGLESANRAGALLHEELQKKAEVLEAKDSLVKELKESTSKTVALLKSQLDARERLLIDRDGELATLRSEITALSSRLRETGDAKKQADRWLQVEGPESQESLMTVRDLQSRLSDNKPPLNTPEGRIQKLEADLREKKTQLARYEIQIRQSMERRDLWKRRLAKFGITLKD